MASLPLPKNSAPFRAAHYPEIFATESDISHLSPRFQILWRHRYTLVYHLALVYLCISEPLDNSWGSK